MRVDVRVVKLNGEMTPAVLSNATLVSAGHFIQTQSHKYAGDLVAVDEFGNDTTVECCEAFCDSY